MSMIEYLSDKEAMAWIYEEVEFLETRLTRQRKFVAYCNAKGWAGLGKLLEKDILLDEKRLTKLMPWLLYANQKTTIFDQEEI